jgi:hypothetical protein
MIDLAAVAPIVEGAGAFPHHELHGYIPEPAESHHLFGAGFLFVGALLIVEVLAGRVWHRNRMRTLIWPAAIMILGEGMVAVTVIDPDDRLIHFTIGLIMMAGGYFEARHRLGYTSRSTANLIIVPALFAGGLEIGVFHFHGDILSNSSMVHVLLGVTAGSMALVRLYQARRPASPLRGSYMGVAVAALAFELMALSH